MGQTASSTQPTPTGLTSAEVAERVAAGKTNANTDVKTKSVVQILREHTFTLFNLVNVALAALVAITGQYRNMTFMLVVIINLVIGVVQETRAKQMVDKLSILTAKKVRVLRDGAECELSVDDLVLDDLFMLQHGDQVPADAVVVAGGPLMDESLLTGESNQIEKHPGDELFSGSFVVAGAVTARVCRVGLDGYAARINAEAHYVKEVSSEILATLKMIIKYSTIALVPLGVGLFIRTLNMEGTTTTDAILSTVAAVVGMIPQGLVLLTSSVLAIATTRLGGKNVLVQQSYCVETLARVDTLCLDKTGTITSGAMEVTSMRAAGEDPYDEAACRDMLQCATTVMSANGADANETALAMLAFADEMGFVASPVVREVPFSSARKYSGCVTDDGRCLVVGAAQFVLREAYEDHKHEVQTFAPTERVLTIAEVESFGNNDDLVGRPHVLGYIGIRDEVRASAPETIRYFAEQGVNLKVISGDDPATVAAIAHDVGIEGAKNYVDASTLVTEQDMLDAVRTKSIFGRVTPQQKRSLVRALHQDGHVVAMTGDGVNDVLALKEADCSVAMAAGSAAARNVAEIVLADNDFAHMPEVVDEGRRSINNLQRSASLFLVKTVFSALLAVVCIVLPPYPFIPIQMTLISSAIIGIPSFVLALEPNHDLVTGDFLENVLRRSLPASAAIVVALILVQFVERIFGLTLEQGSTLSMYLTGIVGVALIVKISQPLTPLRCALVAFVVTMLLGGSLLFRDFFKLAPISGNMMLFLVVAGAGALALFLFLYGRLNGGSGKDDSVTSLVATLKERA
ncbi:MAG: HAD-IC family P-type ATPase [Coriobacteriales bacterium]|nr:HAD-IC family P-type ATPase [Coriobacteriales bacterium]